MKNSPAAPAALPAFLTDSSELQPATVEIAREIYRDCRSRFAGTGAEFRAACIAAIDLSVYDAACGGAAIVWASAALKVAKDLHPTSMAAMRRSLKTTQQVLRLSASTKPAPRVEYTDACGNWSTTPPEGDGITLPNCR